MGQSEPRSKEHRVESEPAKSKESVMSITEFGVTTNVNRTLLSGFTQYCKEHKVPPRLTMTQWRHALTTWQNAPVTH